MPRVPLLIAYVLALSITLPAAAQEPGDSPLTLLYQDTGLLALAHDVEPLGGPDSVGAFVLAGIPVGAVIEQAYFITGNWDSVGAASHTVDLDFNGTLYAGVAADVVDFTAEAGGFDLGGYAIDVTADVSGDGAYPFTVTANQGGSGTNGALLAVVYSDPSNVLTEVTLNFGAEQIRYGSAVTDFPGLTASSGTLHLWTEGDNAFFSDPVEEILLNGSVILGGPSADIFNGNQGPATSYFAVPATVLPGLNTVGINNGNDLFGWHYAALETAVDLPTAVEPSTWGRVKSRFR